MLKYDGEEKRESKDGESLLQQMSVKQAVIANDISHMVEWTKSHTELDDERHKNNLGKFDKIDSTINFHQKIVYGGVGILAAVELLTKFLK